MRKERFPTHRWSKLHPRGDGCEYNISATFNVSDLSPFDVGDDSRTNPFEERGE